MREREILLCSTVLVRESTWSQAEVSAELRNWNLTRM